MKRCGPSARPEHNHHTTAFHIVGLSYDNDLGEVPTDLAYTDVLKQGAEERNKVVWWLLQVWITRHPVESSRDAGPQICKTPAQDMHNSDARQTRREADTAIGKSMRICRKSDGGKLHTSFDAGSPCNSFSIFQHHAFENIFYLHTFLHTYCLTMANAFMP